jgi:hypothetical protein
MQEKKLQFRVPTHSSFAKCDHEARLCSTGDSNCETVTYLETEGNLSCLRAMPGSFRIDRPTSVFQNLHDAEAQR